jgi:RNA polymerase sigma-70 factor (ECF subfamily)
VTESARSPQFQGVEPLDATGRAVPSPEAEAPASAPLATPGFPEFRTLFADYFPYVWHSLRRLGVPDRDLEDLAHDVFLEVYRGRDRYDPARPVRAWLFGFAFRKASHYRRRARHRYEVQGETDERAEAAPTALERVITTEALGVAHTALEALEIDRRAVFLMHEVDGISIPEVAEALGIPLNTAYSRLRLARRDFRKRVSRLRARQGEP